jgi:thiamine-phosphate pyrophosphorylase
MKSSLPSLLSLTTDISDYSHSDQVGILLDAGATFIQIRSKKLSSQELLIQANYASRLAVEKNAVLIINDHVDVAKLSNASGVHLGGNDESVTDARVRLDRGMLVGATVHSLSEAKAVKENGNCDYVGLGPYRFSGTKSGFKNFLSEDQIFQIVDLLFPIPVFLIGGLQIADCSLIPKFNLHGIAVCNGLSNKTKYGGNVKSFLKEINELDCISV